MSKITNYEDYKEQTLKGVRFYNQKDYPNALNHFLNAETFNPKNIKLQQTIAFTYLKLNDLESADQKFKLAIDLTKEKDPDFSMPANFEEMVENLEEYDVVVDKYKTVMKKSKTKEDMSDPRIPVNLGIHLMSEGKYKTAHKVLEEYKKKYTSLS
ncbi:MAG: hypothetical protein OEZ34_17055 [Spirochaetia bacterium]|nr:hypothetical protein [Spirochaetia bacterium]